MASSEVCNLDPVRAEEYEQRAVFPPCKFHSHLPREVAAAMVGDDDGTAVARRLEPQ